MRGELSEYAQGFRGRARLLANTTATSELLPATLAAFLSQHPQIDIDLEGRSSCEIVRAVAGNVAEIVIVGDEVNPARELQTFPFAEDRLVLIAPRDHVVSHQRAIAFRDALAYDHVGLAAGNALQDQMEDHADRVGRTATGALSRTRGLPAGAWCSGTCCIGRDQRHAGVGVAAVDRGGGGRRRATPQAVAVSGGPLRRTARGRHDRRRQTIGIASAPAAAVGRVLAGTDAVARAAARSVLVEAAGREPQRACPRESGGTRWDRVLLLLATYRLLAPRDKPVG